MAGGRLASYRSGSAGRWRVHVGVAKDTRPPMDAIIEGRDLEHRHRFKRPFAFAESHLQKRR